MKKIPPVGTEGKKYFRGKQRASTPEKIYVLSTEEGEK